MFHEQTISCAVCKAECFIKVVSLKMQKSLSPKTNSFPLVLGPAKLYRHNRRRLQREGHSIYRQPKCCAYVFHI